MSGEKKEQKEREQKSAAREGNQASQELTGSADEHSQGSTGSAGSLSAYMPRIPADTGSPLFGSPLNTGSQATLTPPQDTGPSPPLSPPPVRVSGFSFTQFATTTTAESKKTSKLFCFSFSHAISLNHNIDDAIKDSKSEGAVWNRLKTYSDAGQIQSLTPPYLYRPFRLEAHPRIKEIIMGLINAGHQVAIFTGINHPKTEAIIRGFLSEIVKLDEAICKDMTITYAKSMKDASEVNALKVSQVAEIGEKLEYPPTRTVVVDAGVLHQLYTSPGYTFYSVGDERLLHDAGLVSLPSSTSSSSSVNGVAGGNSRKRKAEEHDAGRNLGPG